MTMEWAKVDALADGSCVLHVGTWVVGSISPTSSGERREAAWLAMCGLPGAKAMLGTFASPTDARQAVEREVRAWITASRLTYEEHAVDASNAAG